MAKMHINRPTISTNSTPSLPKKTPTVQIQDKRFQRDAGAIARAD